MMEPGMLTDSPVRDLLRPYLPRLTLEWLATEPECLHREVEGSMVFVDVSGFTTLSEKLARFGRVGAEEMADAINHCFTDLLAVAYEQDGGLIKFGGDALLLLFAGGAPEEHAARAAKAAVGMRRRLRTVGKLQTSGGRVNLRMSVGVHTGRFDFFLVGGSHRELVVTGPAATEVVRMEGAAEAGQVVMSLATAQRLSANLIGSAVWDGFFLRSAPPGASPVSPSSVPDAPEELLRRSVSVAVRDNLLSGVVEPEHRQVTVAFLHFEGTDELLRDAGPDELAGELDRLVRDVQEAVDEYGVCFLGSDVDADGGKLILTAGAPRALGEDEERMLLALRRVVEGERRIPVRIGTTRGGVFAGDIGPAYRRTYTVMGDTVNLAARLMARAPLGEIYASASVLDASGTRFDTVRLEPFLVKGKAKPVQAWSVGPPAATQRRREVEPDRLPLVGRDQELEVLRTAVESARRHELGLVELVGEAGIGKSRLLQEVRALASDFVVTGATGEAYTTSTPYVAWRDMLRELCGIRWEDPAEAVVARLTELLRADAPELRPWIPLIARAAGAEVAATPEVADLGPEFVRPKLHEVVEAFLRVVVRAPTLFAIENANQMDEASADLLSALVVAETRPRPWLFVVCRRPVEAGFRGPEHAAARRLDLQPLDPAASMSLAHAATEEAPIAGHLLQEAVARAGGNPQLLLDLLQAVGTGQGALPESVEAAATVRIDSLPPGDRSLIRRLSVFGLAFHPRFVGEVLDEGAPTPTQVMWERLSAFFEEEGGGYLRFRRGVVRDAAYAGLPFRTRRRLHAAVGRRMERETDEAGDLAGLLAMHFSLAGEDERALRYATMAAHQAREIFANVEAAVQYRRAVDAARRLRAGRDVLLELLEGLGEVLARARRYPEALRANADARALAGEDPIRLARLMLRRAILAEATGHLSQTLRWLTKARRLLAGDPTNEAMRTVAELDARYAAGLQAQGRHRETATMARRAIDEGVVSGSVAALGHAENMLGAALAILGKPGAIDAWRNALHHFEELGDLSGQASALNNLGAGEYFEGRWTEAVEFYRRAAEVSERLGDPQVSTASTMNVGEILIDQGFPAEAEALLREASRVWRATGDGHGLGFCLIQLARATAMSGRTEAALAYLQQARDTYQSLGAPAQVLEVDAREMEVRLLAGDAEDALARVHEIVARLEVEGGVNVLMPLLDRVRGYALAMHGRLAEAEEAFERSAKMAHERGAEHDVALSLQGLARVARRRGRPDTEVEARTAVIFDRLAIRAVPVYPMTAPAIA
jgi:class 3 adenylate cyclase/tetratricopeptide (TPR) repeat protein